MSPVKSSYLSVTSKTEPPDPQSLLLRWLAPRLLPDLQKTPPDPPDLAVSIIFLDCSRSSSLIMCFIMSSCGHLPSSLSLGFVSPYWEVAPMVLEARLLPTTATPTTPPTLLFPQVFSTSPSDFLSLECYWFREKFIDLTLWKEGLARLSLLVCLACLPFCGSLTALVRIIAAECRVVTIVPVTEAASRGYDYRRGCEDLVPSTLAWKLPYTRRPLPQCEEISNGEIDESIFWEFIRSLIQGIDMLGVWSTNIIIGFAHIHLPKSAKLSFSQPHPSLSLYANYGFMIPLRTGSSKVRGTKWGDIEMVDVYFVVGSTSWCYVTLDLEADSIVVNSALASASFTDIRSPTVIASEDVLSPLIAKDDYIISFLGVMYASCGFFYVSHLTNVVVVDLAMIALLSFLLNIIFSIDGV